MKACHICGGTFEPDRQLSDPAELAGKLLAEEEYGDAGDLCPSCLASRGQLAMMYRPELYR